MWGWRRYFTPRDVANSDGGKEAQGCNLTWLKQSMMGEEEGRNKPEMSTMGTAKHFKIHWSGPYPIITTD